MSDWKRIDGGYVRKDGEWVLYRGARMSSGGNNAWLVHRRAPEERIGRDDRIAYDKTNGSILWTLTEDGHLDTAEGDTEGTLYAHLYDAGALAEAKYIVQHTEEA